MERWVSREHLYDKRFERLLDGMALQRPEVVEQMVRWYPINKDEVIVYTKDGCKWAYHDILHTVRKLYDPRDHEMMDAEDYEYIPANEDEWRKEFRLRFHKVLAGTNLTQEMLSERTGISQVTLSKYAQGKSTPSSYNIARLARALHCAEAELTNFNF